MKSRLVPVILLALALMASACAKTIRSTTVDDGEISARVKTAFINDPVVGGARIDVETVKSVVTLSGRVKNKDEEAKAITLARGVRGVSDVKSTLQIEP